ncbi:MAG: SMI1/KNR4 family protein [Hydrotalea flava]|nr:SMI1/KNR4 family protein [Hydrotalea flava]
MKDLNPLVVGCELISPILSKILTELNLSLPDEVFEFYLRNNSQEYSEKSYSEEFTVRGWFCFSTLNCKCDFLNSDFQKAYIHSREFLPEGLVPFAYNYMDDYYLLSLRSIDYGAIYFYRTDMCYEEDGAMILVANNFSQFVDGLKS